MKSELLDASSAWSLPRLGAGGPDPELESRLALFGQFVGDWEITECRCREPDGTWGLLTGELHWRWILRGRTLQDVWTLFDKATARLVYEGTTIRLFDSSSNAWSSTWFSATSSRVRHFAGHEVGGRIVLDERVAPGAPNEHWVFADITPSSFRWFAEQDRRDGSGWILTEEMQIRRIRSSP